MAPAHDDYIIESASSSSSSTMSNQLCVDASGGVDRFPCNVSAPVVASVGIAAGGLALLFNFFLLHRVSKITPRQYKPIHVSTSCYYIMNVWAMHQ
jgi:hypothetical protein